jgi:hypothetical protein
VGGEEREIGGEISNRGKEKEWVRDRTRASERERGTDGQTEKRKKEDSDKVKVISYNASLILFCSGRESITCRHMHK